MRICIATTNFPRHIGDSEGTFVWELARALSRLGHPVSVVAQHWPGLPTHTWMEDIEVFRPRYWWPESAELLRQSGGGLPIVWLRQPWARVQILPFIFVHALTIAHCARTCDVVHAQWTLSAGCAWLARGFHGRPIVATLQGSDVFQVTRSGLGAWLTRLVLARCDRISAISRALADAAAATGVPKSRVTVVPNGVNVEHFVPPSDPREELILYVGTLIKRKGTEYLLQAMPAITERHPTVRLAVVGEGPEKDHLQELTRALGVSRQVQFAGWQPRDSIRKWMQRAKLLVLPSLEEGLGVVLLESMACGTPIVATEVGGIPDVVTPEIGVLVPPADPLRLAEAVVELLSDDVRWQEMSRHARRRVESEYAWPRIAGRFIEMYEGMIKP